LKKILLFSFASYIFLFIVFFIIDFEINKNDFVVIVNVITAITFYSILLIQFSNKNFSLNELLLIITVYCSFYVVVYNILFFINSSTFFEFAAVDSLEYDRYASALSKMTVSKRFDALINGYGKYNFDDMGFTTFLSFLYEVVASNIFVNFVNIILTIISASLLFKLSKNFLSVKGAYFIALLCSISSYTIYLQASGLKEILMNTIILFSFYCFYKYLYLNSLKWLVFAILGAFLILFFRIPISLFLLGSFVSFFVFSEKRNLKKIFLTTFFVVVLFFTLTVMLGYMNNYLVSYDDIVYYQSTQDDFAGLPPFFSGLVSYVVGFAGPFPTIMSKIGEESLSIYAPSLILKVFLFVPFIIGTILIIKQKLKYFYPILFFILIEIVTISFLWQSFEVRKVFPHFPYFFIIAVYYFENNSNRNNFFLRASYIGVPVLVFFWNYLR